MSNILSRDFSLEVAQGNVSGYKVVHKFGRNSDVTASEEDLTELASFIWPTSASTVRIKAGGNAADDSGGAGAREVTVEGLDNNWDEASEAITTNGASVSSATTTQFVRVYRAYVSSAGTYTGNNTGNVVIEDSGGANDLIEIVAGEGQSQYAAYTVPDGYTAYIRSVFATVDAAKTASAVKLYTRASADDTTAPYSPKRLRLFLDGLTGSNLFKPFAPLAQGGFAARTDLWFAAISDATGASISVNFEIILVAT